MKLARFELEPVTWRLRAALVTSRGTLAERAGLRLRISDTDGCRGAGEALPLPSAGTEAPGETRRALERALRWLDGASGELDELLDGLDALCPGEPAARCALDVALHDLAARRAGLPVARLLAGAPLRALPVNALLDSADASAIEAARQRGFATLKLKLPAQPDLEGLASLLRGAARGLRVRVDPNGAWAREPARAALAHPGLRGLELVEQPVAADDLDGLRELARGPLPIAADESLARADGRAALIAGELTPLAVLKPMVLGGLRAAARLARAAQLAGVKCLVTTTLDGPIASAAAAQLAAAVCDGELACGLAASDSVDAAFPAWLEPRAGAIELPALPGLGLGDVS